MINYKDRLDNSLLKRAADVIKTKDPYKICDFAENEMGADNPIIMPLLQQAMIDIGDIYHVYEFAYCMSASGKKNFNLKPIEQLVIESGDAKLMYYFLECVEGCDVENMTQAFIKVADPKWLKEYIENDQLEKFHSEEYLRDVLNKASKERFIPQSIQEFFKSGKTLDEIKDDILATNNAYYITELAEYFPECNNDEMFEAIIKTNDVLHIYEYYCCVPTLTEKQKARIVKTLEKDSRSTKLLYYIIEYTPSTASLAKREENIIRARGDVKYKNKSVRSLKERNISAPLL